MELFRTRMIEFVADPVVKGVLGFAEVTKREYLLLMSEQVWGISGKLLRLLRVRI